MMKSSAAVRILLVLLVSQKKLTFLLRVGKVKEKFCRESMRLKSQYSDSVFEVVVVRDQIVSNHSMVMKVLW